MKHVVMGLVLVVAGFLAFKQMKAGKGAAQQAATAPPPPPPPPVNVEPQPLINPEEQAKIVRAANDQDPNVRWESIQLLDKMKSPQALPLMFDKLEHDSEPDLRVKIVHALGAKRGAEVTQHVVGALKDMEPAVRVAAIDSLEQIGDYSVTGELTDMLKDPEETVKERAIKALNTLQDKKAAEVAAEQKRQEELRRQQEEARKAAQQSH